jgi:hypothetical protein
MATAVLPALLYERLPDLGIDVSVLYPSYGLLFLHFEDEGDRRGACRALNRLNADLYRDYGDRLIPVALVPMHTPEEAVAELEYYALWTDTFGIDSPYDYDPVWEACRRLGVSPSFHSGALGWQNRRSISSYVYNHVGMLGESGHAIAKSLFLGGVTRRFPELNFGFLEGGVAWGASLLADLIGHWEKRNTGILGRHDPAKVDHQALVELYRTYGGPWADGAPPARPYRPEDLALFDEFAACGIERAEDIVDLFVPHFAFGCEADDPMTTTAFNTKVNPFGARLSAIFGSDIAHWDVPDMAEVLGESWELVDHELITTDDYRDFVYANVARFFTKANPAFFNGTKVEHEINELLASQKTA